MSLLNVLGISLGLAMDALAVSIAVGLVLASVTPRQTFRLAFHFGLFQALMPILGWSAGRQTVEQLKSVDHWVVFALLAFVGGKMLWEARSGPEMDAAKDPTRGLSLVVLSLATSLDALAVGFSMALIGVSVWVPAAIIGAVAGGLTAFGIHFGGRIGPRWGIWAETAGGCILIAIGLRILITHLAGAA